MCMCMHAAKLINKINVYFLPNQTKIYANKGRWHCKIRNTVNAMAFSQCSEFGSIVIYKVKH
jgi:hypothetical protein